MLLECAGECTLQAAAAYLMLVLHRHFSLVPRPFPPPVFDLLQYAETDRSCKNWRRKRSGNEATDNLVPRL